MQLIGLTGGIASGKSTVAALLVERGAIHVDADAIAREVVAPGMPVLEQIRAVFGDAVIDKNGALIRPALGAIVFNDPEKRAQLNALMHPAVWQLAKERFDAAEAADRDAVVIYDVPLLVEASVDRPMQFDLVVVVHANMATRLTRLTQLRGMSPAEAQSRINAQADDAARLAIADVVIDTEGSIEHTRAQVNDLWSRILAVRNRTG
jgi:dephospho-CoA kinase